MEQNFCESLLSNTGMPKCDPKFGKPILLAFGENEITPEQMNDLLAAFQTAAKADLPQNRLFPVSGIKQVDDGYAAPTAGTLTGYGYSEQLGDGTLISTFHFPMSICRAKATLGLNGYTGRCFVFTDTGIIACVRKSNGNYAGLPVESTGVQYAGGLFGDGANVKTVQLQVTFGSDVQVVKAMQPLQYDFDTREIIGLQSLELQKVGALEYKVVTSCVGTNLFDDLSEELETPALWKLTKTADGTAVVVSDAAANDANKSFKLTATGLVAPYKITVQLDKVSALDAAGIIGFEQPKALVDNQTA